MSQAVPITAAAAPPSGTGISGIWKSGCMRSENWWLSVSAQFHFIITPRWILISSLNHTAVILCALPNPQSIHSSLLYLPFFLLSLSFPASLCSLELLFCCFVFLHFYYFFHRLSFFSIVSFPPAPFGRLRSSWAGLFSILISLDLSLSSHSRRPAWDNRPHRHQSRH
ncbi:hypothetical protein BDW75DRAFT_42131 [Aspergillus navahoensis]